MCIAVLKNNQNVVVVPLSISLVLPSFAPILAPSCSRESSSKSAESVYKLTTTSISLEELASAALEDL